MDDNDTIILVILIPIESVRYFLLLFLVDLVAERVVISRTQRSRAICVTSSTIVVVFCNIW